MDMLQQAFAAASPSGSKSKKVPIEELPKLLLMPPEPSGLLPGIRPHNSMELQVLAARDFQKGNELWELRQLMEGIKSFGKSAQRGHGVADYCFRWGQYHELAPADVPQALRWYRRGARMNHGPSVAMLAKLLFVQGDRLRAELYWRRLADPQASFSVLNISRQAPVQPHRSLGGASGDAVSQWFIAEAKFQTGTLRDAVRWWKRSAENGDVDAMMRLHSVFAVGGAGIPQEHIRARHWLFAAAANGHQEALKAIPWRAPEGGHSAVERRWMQTMEAQGWI